MFALYFLLIAVDKYTGLIVKDHCYFALIIKRIEIPVKIYLAKQFLRFEIIYIPTWASSMEEGLHLLFAVFG